MIPDAYLNLKYNNYKTTFSFLFLFLENTNSETIPNGPLATWFSSFSLSWKEFVLKSSPIQKGINQ